MIRVLCLLVCCLSLSAAELPATATLFQGEPLLVALERVAEASHAGLVIHHEAQQTVREEAAIPLMDQPWKDFAAALALHGITVHLDGDALIVESRDRFAREHLQRETYSTATMTVKVEPHPGPRLGAQRAPEAVAAGKEFIFKEDGDNASAELIEQVQAGIDTASWANEGVAIEDYNGAMVLFQSPEVHVLVQAMLARLERDHSRQLLVCGYRLAVPPAGKGLILDAAAWAAARKDLPAPEVAFTVIDGQRNHHFSGVRRSYIAADLYENDLDAPILGMLTSGLVLDVQPHVTIKGISANIRLQATVAEKMTTSPVKDAAGRLLFDIDLPDQLLDQADDLRLIPPGGAALYRFDDRTYAVTIDLLDVIKAP